MVSHKGQNCSPLCWTGLRFQAIWQLGRLPQGGEGEEMGYAEAVAFLAPGAGLDARCFGGGLDKTEVKKCVIKRGVKIL